MYDSVVTCLWVFVGKVVIFRTASHSSVFTVGSAFTSINIIRYTVCICAGCFVSLEQLPASLEIIYDGVAWGVRTVVGVHVRLPHGHFCPLEWGAYFCVDPVLVFS